MFFAKLSHSREDKSMSVFRFCFQLHRITVIIVVTELNNRTDFQIEIQDLISDVHDYMSPETAAKEGLVYNTNPYNLRLKMLGSGLYHFRSKVPEHMSYCNLQTQFMVSQ